MHCGDRARLRTDGALGGRPTYPSPIDGVVTEICYSGVTGRAPLAQNEMRYFEEIVSALPQEADRERKRPGPPLEP